ncbi:tRNA (adenosine(37)-N6)-threonylcarbamoyltransferase complex dimerization subunit type 1 TsaB [Desulfatiferula olefinivorans]
MMKLLAVDTTGQGCSVAVTDDDVLLCELNFRKKETHSRHIMGLIDTVLGACRLSIHDIDGYAVSRGPGSFTGLRIGLSTVKGLALVTGKPVAGVSSLDALAMNVPCSNRPVCALIDARKNEVYMARYRWDGKVPVAVVQGCAVGPESLVAGVDEETVFVGSGLSVFGDIIKKRLGSMAVCLPPEAGSIRALHVARLAYKRFHSGEVDRTDSLVPHYIRPSDAELNHRAAPAESGV